MLKRSVAALTVLLLATSAHAEGIPLPVTASEAAPAPPPVAASEAAAPALPPTKASIPSAFMDQFLSYDDDAGVALQGRARQPLSPVALYAALDRPDLIEKSHQAIQRRIILAVAAGTVLAAGVTAAVVAEVGQPNLNTSPCVKVYPSRPGGTTNDFGVIINPACSSEEMVRTTVAAVGLTGGVALGALLGTLAYWSGPSVLSNDETSNLISQHNGVLLKRLRQDSAIHVTPYGSAQGAGVVTTLTF